MHNTSLGRILLYLCLLVSPLIGLSCRSTSTSTVSAVGSKSAAEAPNANPFLARSGEYEPTNPREPAEIIGLVAPMTERATGNCTRCHGVYGSADGINSLSEVTKAPFQCFANNPNANDETKKKALGCFAKLNRTLSADDITAINNGNPEAIQKGLRGLKAHDIGFFTAAVTLPTFQNLFEGNGDRFKNLLTEPWANNLQMPLGTPALSEVDFRKAVTWLIDSAPGREQFINTSGPQVCTSRSVSFIGQGIKDHVKKMSEEGEGWQFKNQANGLKMFACEANGTPCFRKQLNRKDVFPQIGKNLLAVGEMRELHQRRVSRTFWTRSSADGRFLSHGGDQYSPIIDLSPKLLGRPARTIEVAGRYDPGFTPDNLTFMMQGAGSLMCNQSILSDTNINRIGFETTGCARGSLNIPLYQSIGSSLDNGDVVTLVGNFTSDNGGGRTATPPNFGDSTNITLTRLRRSESTVYERTSDQIIAAPYSGNWMLSPSQILAAGSLSSSKRGVQRFAGYRIIKTDSEAIRTRNALPTAFDDPNTALLCVANSEKPQFSFDERYLVYYTYKEQGTTIGETESSSDIHVIDLLGNGKPVQISKFPPGSFAQFPHFRSDGWLYFTYHNAKTGVTREVATDAVIRLQNPGMAAPAPVVDEVDIAPTPVAPIPTPTPPTTESGTPNVGGTYTLTAKHSGKCLDVTGTWLDDRVPLQQWPCLPNKPNQQFTVKDAGNGYRNLVVKHSSKCVDVEANGTANRTIVQQYTCNGTNAQKVKITAGHDGAFQVRFESSDKCMDLYNSNRDDGAKVSIWECVNNANNQVWYFKPVP